MPCESAIRGKKFYLDVVRYPPFLARGPLHISPRLLPKKDRRVVSESEGLPRDGVFKTFVRNWEPCRKHRLLASTLTHRKKWGSEVGGRAIAAHAIIE